MLAQTEGSKMMQNWHRIDFTVLLVDWQSWEVSDIMRDTGVDMMMVSYNGVT